MGLFRGLNLLQSVEARTTLGEELESILSSSLGRKAEFAVIVIAFILFVISRIAAALDCY